MDILNAISGNISNDRDFINKAFAIVFSDAYIRKLIKKGLNRQDVLKEMRETKRYATIKGMSFWYFFLMFYPNTSE